MDEAFAKHNVNPRSPREVGRWLYDDLGYECQVFTKTGARSTSVAALTELAKVSEEADAMLRQRKAQKELTAYYRPLLKGSQDEKHGIATVHPHFSSTRTVTGRFSCSDPNLQTIPRDDVMGGVRKCFVPRDGYKLVEFDLNQAELRVIAGYAREQNMIDALMDPERNLHDETAQSVFGQDYTPLQRRLAKNLNFGFPYGIGPVKFAMYLAPVPTKCAAWDENLEWRNRPPKCGACDTCRADVVLQGYREAYPNLVSTMNGLAKYADKHGRIGVGEWPGRYRHFRGAGYRVPGYTALNAIVQGGIGEFMKDMMIEWMERCHLRGSCRLVLQIHDALVFEVPENVGTSALAEWLQRTADRINPFKLPMLWEQKEWK
jgi:DNA polymerase-1